MLTKEQERLCMKVPEVAVQLGISLPTAYELVNMKSFPSIKYGKRVIIPREAFTNWLRGTVANGRAVIMKKGLQHPGDAFQRVAVLQRHKQPRHVRCSAFSRVLGYRWG